MIRYHFHAPCPTCGTLRLREARVGGQDMAYCRACRKSELIRQQPLRGSVTLEGVTFHACVAVSGEIAP